MEIEDCSLLSPLCISPPPPIPCLAGKLPVKYSFLYLIILLTRPIIADEGRGERRPYQYKL